ncbi:MAG: hypothetical protein K2Q18_10375 [Bdellovibrionales bacterium]|nr:hypothetical protein [Bdellovibrionales bacterium]
MFDIVNGFDGGSNQWLNITLMLFAVLRVYLEIIKFDFATLPITKGMFRGNEDAARKFHRNGLFLSLGYIVLSAPFVLFA